jgi:L-ascorbate metabolism protein UlaG (beta-lactamase superfamily)
MDTKLIYHGHSCFEITGRNRIIIDPFLRNNPNADIGPEDVDCDIIAVTHAHGDHFGDAVEIAQRTKAPIVCIAEIAWYLSRFEGIETVAMNMGGTVKVKETDITMVRADHSSNLQTDDGVVPGGQSAGLIIDSGVSVYHLGDTALFLDLKIYHILYNPQVVLVPIGGHYTMGPKQAALAVEWLSPKLAVPMHYDTWDIIAQDTRTFTDYVQGLAQDRTAVVPMRPGEVLDTAPYAASGGPMNASSSEAPADTDGDTDTDPTG